MKEQIVIESTFLEIYSTCSSFYSEKIKINCESKNKIFYLRSKRHEKHEVINDLKGLKRKTKVKMHFVLEKLQNINQLKNKNLQYRNKYLRT